MDIKTFEQLNNWLRAEYCSLTLARYHVQSDALRCACYAKQNMINSLRVAMGEPEFDMYCEDVDDTVVVFENVKHRRVVL